MFECQWQVTLPTQQMKINIIDEERLHNTNWLVVILLYLLDVNGITIDGYITRFNCIRREHAHNVAWSFDYSFDSYIAMY